MIDVNATTFEKERKFAVMQESEIITKCAADLFPKQG
jgi:hypothetical protein